MRFSGALEGLLNGRPMKRANWGKHLAYSGPLIYVVTSVGSRTGDRTFYTWRPWEPQLQDILAQDWEYYGNKEF